MEVLSRKTLVVFAELGFPLALAVLLAAFYAWDASRCWVPLDTVVTLNRNHIRTAEFEVNAESTYRVEFWWQSERAYAYDGTPHRWTWIASNDGKIVGQGSGDPEGYFPGSFFARKGHYILDLYPHKDAAGDVRMVVAENGSARRASSRRITWTSLLLLAALATAICRATTRWRERQAETARAHSLTQPGIESPGIPGTDAIRRPWQLRAPRPIFAKPSWYSYALVVVLLLAAIPMWLHNLLTTPTGIRVRLLEPGIQNPGIPEGGPLLVQVMFASSGKRPNLFVNSQPVAWEQFDSVLEKELKLRPSLWPVYVQGSGGDLEWNDVVTVIDTVKGRHSHVILLTSNPPH